MPKKRKSKNSVARVDQHPVNGRNNTLVIAVPDELISTVKKQSLLNRRTEYSSPGEEPSNICLRDRHI